MEERIIQLLEEQNKILSDMLQSQKDMNHDSLYVLREMQVDIAGLNK